MRNKVDDDDAVQDRPDMMFEHDQETIKLGVFVTEMAGPRDRPYGHQTNEMWTQNGTLHKRNEDLAKTAMYGLEPREE